MLLVTEGLQRSEPRKTFIHFQEASFASKLAGSVGYVRRVTVRPYDARGRVRG